jgi:hypothetical protein
MDHDPSDALERAERYLDQIRSGGRPLGGSHTDGGHDELRELLDVLLTRLARLERVEEQLAPRGGRTAATLRSELLGERSSIYVQIGAVVARWAKRGGEIALTSDDPDKTALIETGPRPGSSSPLVFPDDADPDATLLAAETVVAAQAVSSESLPPARVSRPPAPSMLPPRPKPPSLESVLHETRRSVRAVTLPEPVGPPPDILGSDPGIPEFGAERASLAAEMTWLDEQGALLPRWRGSTAPLQHAILSWLTARARWCQELLGPGDDAEHVARLFPKLSAFSKRERPGFVYGLRRDHRAQSESWHHDCEGWRKQVAEHLEAEVLQAAEDEQDRNPERALAALEEVLAGAPTNRDIVVATAEALELSVRADDPRLLRLIGERRDALAGDPRFKRVRRALRAMAGEDPDATSDDTTMFADTTLFGDVPSLSAEEAAQLDALAAELRILMVGGEPREVHRQRLQIATGVAELEWAPATRGGGTGKLQSTAESIRRGSWDGVVLLPRFCGHDVDAMLVPACKASETPWLHLRGGYGVGPMREAVRQLAGHRDGGEPPPAMGG